MKNILLILFLVNFCYSQSITIYGLITDQETGESLIGANVFIENTGFGSYSDKNGFYSITLDNYINEEEILVIQYLGYKTIQKKITLSSSIDKIDIPSSDFNILKKKISQKNIFRPYPDINDIPN